MGAYNFPFPNRRRSARTPPFVPSRGAQPPVTQPPSPLPIPPQAGAAPPTGVAPPEPPGIGRRVVDWLTNPEVGTYFAGVSNRLLAPRQFGETATSQIMGGLLGGYNDVASRRQMMYNAELQQREMARKAGLEEREIGVKEAGEIRQQTEGQARASREGRRVDIEGQRAQTEQQRADTDVRRQGAEATARSREIDESVRHHKELEKKAEADVRAAEQRVKNYSDRNEILKARETNRAVAEARRDKIAAGNLDVTRKRIKLEEAREKRLAAETGDPTRLKKLELAHEIAGRELDAQTKAMVGASEEEVAAIIEKHKARVQEVLAQIDSSLSQPASAAPASSSTKTRIKVRLKDGREGTIDPSEFDSKTMTKVP